jgi:hypothetical protein
MNSTIAAAHWVTSSVPRGRTPQRSGTIHRRWSDARAPTTPLRGARHSPGAEPTRLEDLGGGFWSAAYGYRIGDAELVLGIAAFPDRPLVAVALVVGPLVELPVLALVASRLAPATSPGGRG